MTQSFDDTELMAFADGVLDEPRFSEVAAAIEADPRLAERLELIVAGGKAAGAVFAPLAGLPLPGELTARVKAAIAAHEGRVVPFRRRAAAWLPVPSPRSLSGRSPISPVVGARRRWSPSVRRWRRRSPPSSAACRLAPRRGSAALC